MKQYTFYRESNKFDDILNDVALKKLIRLKLIFRNYLEIGIEDSDEKILTYIEIKYGDSLIKKTITEDYSPVPHKDYIPVRK